MAAGRHLDRLGARALHGDGGGAGRDIFQFHLVGDDVALDELRHFLAQLGLGIDQEAVFQAQEADVGLDASLRVQQEGVAAGPRCHLLYVVAADVVQQADAIAAACLDASALGEIHPRRAMSKCLVALAYVYPWLMLSVYDDWLEM